MLLLFIFSSHVLHALFIISTQNNAPLIYSLHVYNLRCVLLPTLSSTMIIGIDSYMTTWHEEILGTCCLYTTGVNVKIILRSYRWQEASDRIKKTRGSCVSRYPLETSASDQTNLMGQGGYRSITNKEEMRTWKRDTWAFSIPGLFRSLSSSSVGNAGFFYLSLSSTCPGRIESIDAPHPPVCWIRKTSFCKRSIDPPLKNTSPYTGKQQSIRTSLYWSTFAHITLWFKNPARIEPGKENNPVRSILFIYLLVTSNGYL